MTVTEAAKQWEKAKREMDRLKPLLETAAEVLKAHLVKTGKTDLRGRIGLSYSHQMRLDSQKVKEELGERLPDFQKPVTYHYLTLLKP